MKSHVSRTCYKRRAREKYWPLRQKDFLLDRSGRRLGGTKERRAVEIMEEEKHAGERGTR
eukprot:6180192-Pleurochrysis_carterae.AAC.4